MPILLLDIAHSRYRPGKLLRYKHLEKLQDHISAMKNVRESIYVVYETREEEVMGYLVEMD